MALQKWLLLQPKRTISEIQFKDFFDLIAMLIDQRQPLHEKLRQ